MAIKSFSIVKSPRQGGLRQPVSLLPPALSVAPLKRGAAHELRQEVAQYHVNRVTPPLVPQGAVVDAAMRQYWLELEERVVARMSAEFSRLLQHHQADNPVSMHAQDEASIDQALSPPSERQSARAWQIEQNTRLRAQFIDQCELLNSKQVADLLDSKAKNRAAKASHLKDKGKVFCVRLHGQDYFPAFQFDALGQCCHPEMAEVILARQRDCEPGWQLALWFNAANAWLDGQTPLAVWANDRHAVVNAAVAESAAFDA